MSHAPRYSAKRRAAMLDSITAAASSGRLRFYSGAKPDNADAPITGTLLAELRMNPLAFGSATNASVLTANPITPDTNAAATGNATHYRLWEADGTTPISDGTVGTTEDFDCTMANTAIQIHAAVSCSSFRLGLPA